MSKVDNKLSIMLETGFQLPDDKQIYFNALTTSISAADVTIVLQVGDKPIALLRTPHTVAKAMVEILAGLLENFENKAEIKILSVNDITKKMEGENYAPD